MEKGFEKALKPRQFVPLVIMRKTVHSWVEVKGQATHGENKPIVSLVTIGASADGMERRHLDRQVAYDTAKPSEAKQKKITLNGGGVNISRQVVLTVVALVAPLAKN